MFEVEWKRETARKGAYLALEVIIHHLLLEHKVKDQGIEHARREREWLRWSGREGN